jgi:mutual gliding-motility protein MglA
MSFIDEAAREINVKIVWYSAGARTAAALVRYIERQTSPDARRRQVLDVGDATVTVLQWAPPTLGKIRGFTVRFHLYAVEPWDGADDTVAVRALVFRGADACVFIGGPDEAQALARVDGILATHGYARVPIVYGLEGAGEAEIAGRASALAFPAADAFAIDAIAGTGVFQVFKAIARKVLESLAGRPVSSRPTPAPGTAPVELPPAQRAAPTLVEMHEGLDAWQRAYHEKAVWVVGLEDTRVTPNDAPDGYPAHVVHVVVPHASDGFAVMSNGFSRDPRERIELRADTSRYGRQIAMIVSFLGRIWFHGLGHGGARWKPYDLVTTAEAPIFGMKHFVLMPGGDVRVSDDTVTLFRVVPVTPAERSELVTIAGTERVAAWLDARRAGLLDRWLPALEHDRPFAVRDGS